MSTNPTHRSQQDTGSLVALLNELLEAERAGAKVLRVSLMATSPDFE